MTTLFDPAPAPADSGMPQITSFLFRRRKSLTRQQIIISGTVGLLTATVLICAGLVAVPLWSALVQRWPAANECSAIKDNWARQVCYTKKRAEPERELIARPKN